MAARAGPDEWLRRARRHLRVAKVILESGFADAAAFYSQQAAEFALKALQLQQSGTFSKIHDLTRLASSLSAPQRIANLAALLTPAYVGARYPDVGGGITRRTAEAALDAAKKVVRWVQREMA